MNVRLLLNENFPRPSVSRLRDRGFDVLPIAQFHPGLSDTDVLALAVREHRWLVTFDRDYGELIFASGLPPPPAVILLRVRSYSPTDPADWIMDLSHNPHDHIGRFVLFDGSTLRSRMLPKHRT